MGCSEFQVVSVGTIATVDGKRCVRIEPAYRDALLNLERISDHAKNIIGTLKQGF